MQAIYETAETGKQTFQRILVLRQQLDEKVVSLGRRAENARKLIMHLYGSPVVSVKYVSSLLGLNYHTANQLVCSLVDLDVLEEGTGYRRNRIFIFRRYIEVFESQN